MKKYSILSVLSSILLLSSCYKESRLLVNADFVATIVDDNYTAPVKIQLENTSTGSDFYKWTFEGGTPAESGEKNPQNIVYSKAGTYTIKLEAWNDHERGEKEFSFTVDSAVTVGFDTEILINDFAPATVSMNNTTKGGSTFEWTFEGGTPATSTLEQPGDITFSTEGEHAIHLKVSNGRESFALTKTIVLKPSLEADFEIEPSFDDFDYEVPFTASLLNKSRSGLTYEWTCANATFTDKNAENADITITNAGKYTITLKAQNGKETKTVSKEITLKANSNLYVMKDVKFGIKSAVTTLGSYYSLKDRKIYTQSETNSNNGNLIDLVFFGINANFDKCYFVSPDAAGTAGFYPIPAPKQTYLVNVIDGSGLTFTANNFDTMTNDELLRTLDIKSASNTTSWFIANPVPRIVLFETADGRKGAIKVKAFVSEQGQSYVLTDIKFQKEKTQ